MASSDSWRARAWGPELPEEWEGEVGDSKVGQVGCREEDGASWWATGALVWGMLDVCSSSGPC